MATIRKSRRFKINPVEVVVFAIVTLIFFSSVYKLFYDFQGFQARELRPPEKTEPDSSRLPASMLTTFDNYEFNCKNDAKKDTNAGRIRLSGPLCGGSKLKSGHSLLKTEIVNSANQSEATVFPDVAEGTFLTDYIPLDPGENPISLKFFYHNGKHESVVTKRFRIQRKN